MNDINDGSFTAERMSGAAYLKKVNEILSGRFGVSYHADSLWRDIHGCAPGGEMAKLRTELERGTSPEAFAATLASDAGLKPLDQMPGVSRSAARTFNLMKAGLIGFADEQVALGDGNWGIGLDGTVYRQGPDGLAKIEPRLTDLGLDYMVSEAPGGLMDNTGAGALLDLVDSSFEAVASGRDIGDAWNAFLSERPSYSAKAEKDEDTYRPRF